MTGKNEPLSRQIQILHDILRQNEPLYHAIRDAHNLGLSDYYIGAGCIAQTVWNHQCGKPLLTGVKDIDLVYFDTDLSEEAERAIARAALDIFATCPLEIDVNNQARVHLWYKDYFGYEIAPYESLEGAVNTWPTTATAVGVRLEGDVLRVYAPFGLNDLFSQIVRPNKAQITREIYEAKACKWARKWPSLTVVPW